MSTPADIERLEEMLAAAERECGEARAEYMEKLLAREGITEMLRSARAKLPAAHATREMQENHVVQGDQARTDADMGKDSLLSDLEDEDPQDALPLGIPLDLNLKGATNHMDRVKVLASHTPNNEISIDGAGAWLIAAGYCNAGIESIRSTLYGRLKRDPDFVRLEGPGRYRYEPSETSEASVSHEETRGEFLRFPDPQSRPSRAVPRS